MRSVYYTKGFECIPEVFYESLTEKQEKRFIKKLYKWDYTTGKGFNFWYFNKRTKKLTKVYAAM